MKFEFELGDIVFLRVKEDRVAGMVTVVSVRPGHVLYGVSWASSPGSESFHYAMELTSEFVPQYDTYEDEA